MTKRWWLPGKLDKNMQHKSDKINATCTGFFKFEMIIHVLVSSFHFFWIPMSWVYNLYKYLLLLVRVLFFDMTSKVDLKRLKQAWKCEIWAKLDKS